MKKLFYTTMLLASLTGCGGSDSSSDDGVTSSTINYKASGLGFYDITNKLDVSLHLYNQLDDTNIAKGNIIITFDINNNSVFDDGDIKITIGNSLNNTNAYYNMSWTAGDFIVSYNKSGTIISVRPNSGIIVGSNNILADDIGAVSYRRQSVDGNFVSNYMIIRVNRAFTENSTDAQLVKQSLNQINSTTPFNVQFSDGVNSADYIPEKDIFSQGSFTDNQNDYTGNNNSVDLKSIEINNS